MLNWWSRRRRWFRPKGWLARAGTVMLAAILPWMLLMPLSSPVDAQSGASNPISSVMFIAPNSNGQTYQAGTLALWQVEAFTTQAVYGSVSLQLTGPPGTQWPLDPAAYSMLPRGVSASFIPPVVTAVYGGSASNTVQLITHVGPGAPSSQATIPNLGVKVFVNNVVNPGVGTYLANEFGISLNGDPTVHPTGGMTFTNPILGPPNVTPHSLQGGAATRWSVTFAVYHQQLSANDTLTLSGPPGTQFPQSANLYSLATSAGPVAINNLVLSGHAPSNSTTLVLGAPLGSSSQTTPVTLAVYGVTNPAPGTYAGSDFSVHWQSSTASGTGAYGYASQGAAVGSLAWAPDTSLVANASASWTATVRSPVAVDAGHAWTFTAPWTFPTGSGSYRVSVNHGSTAVPSSVSASGQQVTLTLPQSVAVGETVTTTVSGITNPTAGAYSGTAWTVAARGVTMTATQGYTWVQSEPTPTVHVTTFQAGAPGVTWTLAFPAEVALSGGDTVTLYDQGAGFPTDPAEYHLSVAGGPAQTPTAVHFHSTTGSVYGTMSLTLPNSLTASPLDPVQVQIGGVTNPTGQTAELAVSTTGVPAGPLTPFPSSGAGAFGPVGVGGNPHTR